MIKKRNKSFLSRIQFLKGMSILGASALVADSLIVESNNITIVEKTIPICDLPETFEGFRLCHLTDIHHGLFVNMKYIRNVIAKVNKLKPDVVVLTGDYIDNSKYPLTDYYVYDSSSYVEPLASAIGLLEVKYGIIAVLGNHDHRRDVELVRKAFQSQEILLIDNTHRLIEKDGDTICIAGVGDLWEDIQDLESALKGISYDIPCILLSHNPDYAEEMPKDERVDLILSGHTHGGQIRMPFSFAPYLSSSYGQKYAGGLVKLEHTQVYVSRGIGVAFPPARFNCPPEITLINLTRFLSK